jgi:nucleoside-diphosphate-sugar epimerase
MRFLITGASGFIGSRLTRRLVAAGHEVFAIYREESRRVEYGTPLVWDLGAAAAPEVGLPQRLDGIAHLAQSRNYRCFPTDAPEMFRVNVAGTAALLQLAAQAGVEAVSLISSGTVYEPYNGQISEDAPVQPTSFLGASKLAAEALAWPYAGVFRLSVLRLFFPYGPGQETRLVPDLVTRLRSGAPIQLAADGEGLRLVPTFVDDIVDIIAAALEQRWCGTYNVASPAVVSLRQLTNLIAQVLGISPVFELTDRPATEIVPRIDRLRAMFDLNRLTPLRTGIERTLEGTEARLPSGPCDGPQSRLAHRCCRARR